MTAGTGSPHRVPLGGTGWWVWRDVVVRSAGFPASGLLLFAAPQAARAADALLAGKTGQDRPSERPNQPPSQLPGDLPDELRDELRDEAFDTVFEKVFAEAVADSAERASRLAADPLLREAVTWQNHRALVALDGLATGGGDAPRNVRRRDREKALVRYWQRYCGKNETIGFFGPVLWGSLREPGAAGGRFVEAVPGPGLVRQRRVRFESWALAAFGDRLAADPQIRRWFPPALQPHLTLAGREVLRPVRPPLPVSAVEAAALAACDGRRPAVQVIEALLADQRLGLRCADDGYLLLDRLVERDLITWDAALPGGLDAERVLRDRLDAIGDPQARRRATEAMDRLCAARDAVAAAAGDQPALHAALTALDAEFTTLTGRPATRGEGRAYAGRTVCFEDTTRDLDIVIGTGLLAELAEPLAIMLGSARWLTAMLSNAVDRLLRELVAELAQAGSPVRLADVWYLAQGQLFGANGPVGPLLDEFGRRWAELLGVDSATGDRVRLTAAELAARMRDGSGFDAQRPGWPSARLHGVDLQLCASSVAALNRGDYLAVLGELHPAVPAFDTALFTCWHPQPRRLRAERDADVGPSVVMPLFPDSYPRQNSRTGFGLAAPGDVQLGIDASRAADHTRLLPATAATVHSQGGELVVHAQFAGSAGGAPDRRCWPLLAIFADMLCQQLMDGFKLLGAGRRHCPRVTVDRLVVARQSWRTTIDETGLADVTRERDRYLAARRWRAALGLPDRVYVRVSTEAKPCYVDLTGPLYVQMLCTMLRTARAEGGGSAAVTVSEALPDVEQAWLPDAAGRTYSSELRLQITDPAEYRAGNEGGQP